jgi:hypothetical protein
LLWITGARPAELILLKREDFKWDNHTLRITLTTLKLKQGTAFHQDHRTLDFVRPYGIDTSLYIESIIKYIRGLNPNEKIFENGYKWIQTAVRAIGQRGIDTSICPYVFRHSVMSHLAQNGMDMVSLLEFKGGKDYKSVMEYLKGKPFRIDLQKLNRDKTKPIESEGTAIQFKPEEQIQPQPEHPAIQPEHGVVNPPIEKESPILIQSQPIQANPETTANISEKADEGTMDHSQGASPPDPTPDAARTKLTGTAKEAPKPDLPQE